jgi:hypothetical protein
LRAFVSSVVDNTGVDAIERYASASVAQWHAPSAFYHEGA